MEDLQSITLQRLIAKCGFSSWLDFAKHSGIHRNTLSNILSGKGSAFSIGFTKIAKALGLSAEDLYRKIDDANPENKLISLIKPLTDSNPNLSIMLFGSRAKGNFKKFSDWDLGVTALGGILADKEFLMIKSAIEDLTEDFPYMVDLINIDSAPEWFIEKIDYKPKYLCGSKEAFYFTLGNIAGKRKILTTQGVEH